ncbi:MAG TPA: hypothetical protein VFW04_19240 [Gemmatimonadaceae bacterium]|nr:hypothetical protein [Gemmatimonadaceae bacterium]
MNLSFWKRREVASVLTEQPVPAQTRRPIDLRWQPILADALEATRWWLDRHTVQQLANGDVCVWWRIKDDDKPSAQFLRQHIRKEDFAVKTVAVVIPDEAPPIIERRQSPEWQTSEPGGAVRSVVGLLWFEATVIAGERAEKQPNIDGRWVSTAGTLELRLDLQRRGVNLEGHADLITAESTSRFRVIAVLTDADTFMMELHRDPEPLAYFRVAVAIIGDGAVLETLVIRSDMEPIPFTLRRPDDDFSPQYAINITTEQYHRGRPFEGLPWYSRIGDLLFTFSFVQLTDERSLSALHGVAEMVGRNERQVLPIKGAIAAVLDSGARPSVEMLIGDHYKFSGYLAETNVLRGFAEDHDHRLPMVIARQGNPEMLAAIREPDHS